MIQPDPTQNSINIPHHPIPNTSFPPNFPTQRSLVYRLILSLSSLIPAISSHIPSQPSISYLISLSSNYINYKFYITRNRTSSCNGSPLRITYSYLITRPSACPSLHLSSYNLGRVFSYLLLLASGSCFPPIVAFSLLNCP